MYLIYNIDKYNCKSHNLTYSLNMGEYVMWDLCLCWTNLVPYVGCCQHTFSFGKNIQIKLSYINRSMFDLFSCFSHLNNAL